MKSQRPLIGAFAFYPASPETDKIRPTLFRHKCMLNIITALPCEAKPLIKHFRLNGRQAENGFRIYENDQLRLIIAGIGKCAAAAACAYLQGMEPAGKHVWLNLGIAGHATLEIGEAVLAHKISDAATGVSWYPPMPFKRPCRSVELITRDQAEEAYDQNAAVDMEAAGFYATAIRFNSSELVQVFKIISDNQTNPAEQVSAAQTEALIDAKLDVIDRLIQQLLQMDQQSRQLFGTDLQQQFMQRWHFTVSQQHQLLRLLQRWQAKAMPPVLVENFMDARNSKAVIALIAEQIESAPLRFEDS